MFLFLRSLFKDEHFDWALNPIIPERFCPQEATRNCITYSYQVLRLPRKLELVFELACSSASSSSQLDYRRPVFIQANFSTVTLPLARIVWFLGKWQFIYLFVIEHLLQPRKTGRWFAQSSERTSLPYLISCLWVMHRNLPWISWFGRLELATSIVQV